MKKTGASQPGKTRPDFRSSFRLTSVLLLVLAFCSVAIETQAAKITFAPDKVLVTAAPGEAVAVPVSVSLMETTTSDSYASFTLSHVDGTLDPAWMKSRIPVSLNAVSNTRQVLFQISVPAEAPGGQYTSVFRTEGLRSSEQVDPVDLLINLAVDEPFACNQVPLFSDISSTEEALNVRMHREVTIDLAGAVSVPEGCEIFNAWYQLTDEYGELDRTEPLEINDDGTFSVAVPMVASRKGEDKDGRLYTVTFMAENEAGVGESPETTVVVMHDRHTNGHYDSKRWGHDNNRSRHDGKRNSHNNKKSGRDS